MSPGNIFSPIPVVHPADLSDLPVAGQCPIKKSKSLHDYCLIFTRSILLICESSAIELSHSRLFAVHSTVNRTVANLPKTVAGYPL